ncbi:MAG TPA: ribokinase [Bryocella sp.]|nr:ribokinase [Bryocella sp.]
MKPIVVVGSINMDMVSHAHHLPRAGETIIGTSFNLHSGGKGANQAVAVARLGHPSILLGKIGSDGFGQQLLETLSGYGVDTQHIEISSGSSGTATIVVDAAGENCIVVTPGANLEVTPHYLRGKMDILRSAGMVLAQLEIPLPTVEWLAGVCEEAGISLMLDPAPARLLPQSLLARVTWFTPNETEAGFYAPNASSEDGLVRKLRASGVSNLILKRGSEGALLAQAEDPQHSIAAFPVSALDTTAAGDAFNGAFAVAMERGYTPVESARFAAAAAAVSVTREGAQPSLPSGEETEELLQLHGITLAAR